jgi:hypothetical protein
MHTYVLDDAQHTNLIRYHVKYVFNVHVVFNLNTRMEKTPNFPMNVL